MLPYLNPRFNDKSSNEVVTIRGPLQGYVSPFDFEAMYYDKINPLGQVA